MAEAKEKHNVKDSALVTDVNSQQIEVNINEQINKD